MAPLSEFGIFSSSNDISNHKNQWIREQKLSISVTVHSPVMPPRTDQEMLDDGQWQFICFGRQTSTRFFRRNFREDAQRYLSDTFDEVIESWTEVLAELDRQISVPVDTLTAFSLGKEVLIDPVYSSRSELCGTMGNDISFLLKMRISANPRVISGQFSPYGRSVKE